MTVLSPLRVRSVSGEYLAGIVLENYDSLIKQGTTFVSLIEEMRYGSCI